MKIRSAKKPARTQARMPERDPTLDDYVKAIRRLKKRAKQPRSPRLRVHRARSAPTFTLKTTRYPATETTPCFLWVAMPLYRGAATGVNIFDCMFDSAIAIPFEVPTQEPPFLRLTVEPYYLKQRITVGLFGETDASRQSRAFFVRMTHRSRINDVVHCCLPKNRMAHCEIRLAPQCSNTRSSQRLGGRFKFLAPAMAGHRKIELFVTVVTSD